MNALTAMFVVALGVAFGSFANAFVWRFGREERITDTHSLCVHCRHPLRAADLIPLLSFFILRGRCRYCKHRIPWHYPVVELAAGLLMMPLFVRFGITPAFILAALTICVLFLLFLLDLRYSILPDSVTLPGILLALVAGLVLQQSWKTVVFGGILGAGFFFLQYVISRGRWIGGGDIRLGGLMGVLLGWQYLLVALFLAYLVGAAVGLVLLARGTTKWGSQIPFGTFLTVATYATLLWGEPLLTFYLKAVGLR